MSSQASSAGHGEKEVRRKIIETGAVDVMISIRSNFFYTRTVPCELWFFDRGKPAERRDKLLMLDARNIYRKVSRKINDFSREQLANLSAIVWLYRGQSERFLALVGEYLAAVLQESAAIAEKLRPFEEALKALRVRLDGLSPSPLVGEGRGGGSGAHPPPRPSPTRGEGEESPAPEGAIAFQAALAELREAAESCAEDQAALLRQLDGYRKKHADTAAANREQHAARKAFEPVAERLRGLVKQVDLVYKLAARAVDAASLLSPSPLVGEGRGGGKGDGETFDHRAAARQLKLLDAARKDPVEQLKRTAYFHKQVVWLQDRFPEAKLRDVPGLVKLVDRQEIEAADWSLTPGRYVGVAPPEEDDDFDFEATLRDIHTELAGLNEEAAELAKKIQANFGSSGYEVAASPFRRVVSSQARLRFQEPILRLVRTVCASGSRQFP
jgi:type I restriction enzyme M protein